jgi:hypothetical protein
LLLFGYGLGYDSDIVSDMILIWFGNGAAFLGFPMGWLGKRKLKEPRDRLLVGFAMVFIT